MNIKDSFDEILSRTDHRFGDSFYHNLFLRYPEMEDYFRNVDLRRQGVMLTMAIEVVVYHYRRPNRIMEEYLWMLGYRHHELGIEKDAYQKFHNALLETLRQFHGKDWNEELAAEWHEALQQAVSIMLHGHRKDFMLK